MTHPTGDALRAREEAADLEALSAAATPGEWRVRRGAWPTGDVAGLSAEGGGDVMALNGVRGRDAAYIAALVNAHRSGALLDLRSDAGREVADALRECIAALDREALCYANFGAGVEADRCAGSAERARAALALLDAMKEEPHG